MPTQILSRPLLNLVLIGATACLCSCHSAPTKSLPSTTPAFTTGDNDSNLTREEASSRKERVSNVQYNLNVQLDEKSEMFSGQLKANFNLNNADQPLRMDFFEGEISRLTINGKDLALSAKKKYWIELPADRLSTGVNTVTVEYRHEYSHQGQGLHKFVDPESKEVFLYTQFESFDANRFMPCFDQPNLRAVFTMAVEAPKSWTVISTTSETSVNNLANGRRLWSFPATPPIATYLFSLHAGPFKVWTDKFENIPLRLFVRPSLAKYVDPKEWFTYTKQGLGFYNSYFAFPYPFKKYDQIVVPDFNAGAMENVAAVTFTEAVVARGPVTRAVHRNLAGIILHEMAHMWFGDIVTMNWWNDLWLNESFASFMADLSAANATEFKEAWQAFYVGDKAWAYMEDGLVTTHPIEAPIPTVKDAFANFDGITYGKGASVLKQLWAYMTPEKFQHGLQNYIRTYAYQNATLKDFVATLQAETDRNLSLWSDRWLKQIGPDKLAARWTCKGDQLEKVVLTSTPTKGAQFRPQAFKLALFTDQGGRLSPPVVVPVDLNQDRVTLSGQWACPSFVYPNFQDEAYAEVSLDPTSQQYAWDHLSQFQDTLLRTMVWNDLWQMVREVEMPLHEYVQILEKHFPAETDPMLALMISATLTGKRGESDSIINYWPQDSETQRAERQKFISQFEDNYLKRFRAAAPGSDDQRQWFDSYVALARTPKALAQVKAWALNINVAKGFTLDLDRRWTLVRQLSRYQQPGIESLITQLQKLDRSERGHRSQMAVEAVRPVPAIKQKWVEALKEPKPKLSFAEARTVLYTLFPLEQVAMTKPFVETYYDYLRKNGNSENEIFVTSVARALSPLNCEKDEAHQMREFLQSPVTFTPSLQKLLKVRLQEDERCQKIRAFSALR